MDNGPTFSAVIYNLQLRLANIERVATVAVSWFGYLTGLVLLIATYDVILAGLNPLARIFASLAVFGISQWVFLKNYRRFLRSQPTDVTKIAIISHSSVKTYVGLSEEAKTSYVTGQTDMLDLALAYASVANRPQLTLMTGYAAQLESAVLRAQFDNYIAANNIKEQSSPSFCFIQFLQAASKQKS